ncbi:DNA-methyltransferase Dcm [Beggiatoa alba B18LD]|uniref:Cytosine-specific methyltransferase n=1 Tax=Beggiatoa alba B18LD TaxID=395493 RepID=I3CD30_9GAMM|nr:DNA (cytosine-5-)-methyltransferase [Beggiatoa alba]EIJ41523.1 DNA-methyltransferase Dcm [Beggiatoa alba B18LD]
MSPSAQLIEQLDKAAYIRAKRQRMGLSQQAFATLLDMKENGERTVRGWENGEHVPTPAKFNKILALPEHAPFRHSQNSPTNFRFIDLFAGIGGIRLPFQELGGKCVFSSEWDKFAQVTYAANYGEVPAGDITQIPAKNIADHDVLLAGFPCQAFSQAGLRQGFYDTRGTMFFEIQRILAEKRPKAFLLENVKQLRGHDKGRTLATILAILRGEHQGLIPDDVPMSEEARDALGQPLNYWVDFQVLRAADFGVPQNRERIFIIGFDRDYFGQQVNFSKLLKWPTPSKTPTRLGDILEDLSQLPASEDYFTISDKIWQGHQRRRVQHANKGNGFGYTLFDENSPYTNTISARYYKDGSEILINQSKLGRNPRLLTPRECARLQGFPEEFVVDAVSRRQIYQQIGNSVCVVVIRAVAQALINAMQQAEQQKAGLAA